MYEYMQSLRNNTHVRIKIYQEFYHGIIYIDIERRRHVRIII